MGVLFSTIIISNAQNTVQKIIGSNQGLHIGGYGQIDYNKQINNDLNHNANNWIRIEISERNYV